MDHERLDLSAIDPTSDPQRWERLVQSVASRAWEAHRVRVTVHLLLVTWARPVLAVAATVALVAWTGALSTSRGRVEPSLSSEDPVVALATWAASDRLPATDKVLYVMGVEHAIE
jgi:hypothetical protein